MRAVNDTRDNDTIAAIVGAAVGALHGRSRLPQRWLDDLLGRTRKDDDGAVIRFLDEAFEVFGTDARECNPARDVREGAGVNDRDRA